MRNINSPEEMYTLGKSLSKDHKMILLYGDLGAGKTTFIKGFAHGIGIDSLQVQSPTYTYLNVYDGKLLHIDMYRFENFVQVLEKGVLNQIADFDYIVIEWPKRVDQLDLEEYLSLQIDKISASARQVRIIE